MKTKLGLTASFVALGGCSMLQSAGMSLAGDMDAYSKMKVEDQRFCDNLSLAKGKTDAPRGDYRIRDKEEVDNIDLVFERAEACRRWYSSLAGIAVGSDAAGATLASGGGIGLASNLNAATTNTYLAALTLAPTVIREVTRLEPQGILAHQAAEATTLAQCQMLRVREGLHDLLDERETLQDSISAARRKRTELTGAIEDFVNQQYLANAELQPRQTFAQLVAQSSELKELVHLARKYDDLISAADELLTQIDLRTGYVPVQWEFADATRIAAVIAAPDASNASVMNVLRGAEPSTLVALIAAADPDAIQGLLFGDDGAEADKVAELFKSGGPARIARLTKKKALTPDQLKELTTELLIEQLKNADRNTLGSVIKELNPAKVIEALGGRGEARFISLVKKSDSLLLADVVQTIDDKLMSTLISSTDQAKFAPQISQTLSQLNLAAARRMATRRIDERLALDVNTKMDAINLIWNSNFQQLTPKPEASLRTVLAAPFSITAKLIAGDEPAAGNPQQVARATYDFSGSYGAHGVKAFALPTILVAVDKAQVSPTYWRQVDVSLDGMRGLSSSMSKTNQMLSDVADLDAQSASGYCRITSSRGIGVPAPAPAPVTTSTPPGVVLVMAQN